MHRRQRSARAVSWCLLLLGSLAGLCLRAQAPLPQGSLTPDTLGRFCAAQGSPACVVFLDGQYTLALRGDWQLPRSIHLRFAPGSALHVTGGTLDFSGGSVEAPPADTIFPDANTVRGLAASRPEWFVAGSSEPMPRGALAAAYAATEPWGTLYLQARAYVSPFSECPSIHDSVRYLSPRTLVGSGRPIPDDPVQPTHLQAGTILLGGIMGTAPLRAAHLGIDAGPQISASITPGCQLPAVFIEQPANHQFVSGDRLEDVSVLTTGAKNMHSVMIAGHDRTEVRDLWIWTLGGTHGLVMKSSNSVVDGLHCAGAVSDCLIVKSDYATDLLGRAVHDRVAHVDIHPLQPGGYVGGILVDSSWDTVHSLDMRDITETGTRYSMVIFGSRFYRPHNITVENWSTDAVTGFCLWANRTDALQVSNLRCGVRPSAVAGVLLTDDEGATLHNVRVTCQADAFACAAAHTDGVQDQAVGTTFQGVDGSGLGGYLLRGDNPPAKPEEWRSTDMNDRVFAQSRIPSGTRFASLPAEIKPDMRILYTATHSQAILHPTLSLALTVLAASLIGSILVYRRRRKAAR